MKRLSRPARILFLSVLTTLLVSAGLGTFLAFTVFAATPPPFVPKHTIPLTDVNPYGANFFLEREVEVWKRERTVSMAKAAGITWARQQFPWEEIEAARGEFNWSKYDDIVALYRRQGIQVIARLDRPPLWARTNPSGTGSSGPPDNFDDYGSFVEAFVRHYQGQIYYLQIWNEPNLAREWNDTPIDPANYVRLLKTAFLRAKAVDPNVRILTAPLAITLGEAYPNGQGVFRNMNDLQFLIEMYEAGAKQWFDILSANAFGLASAPEDPPDPGKLNFQRVALERNTMEKYGDGGKAVWINEYGWNAPPASIADTRLIWGRVSEEQQADYTIRGIQFARKNWPWVGVISVWFFRQVGDIPLSNQEYYFRLVDPDFTARPAYIRLQQAAGTLSVPGPGEYGAFNPALEFSGFWTPQFDSTRGEVEEMTSEEPNAQVALRFWGDGLDLVAHVGPSDGRLTATLDGQNLRNLPHGPDGRGYLDLAATEDKWGVELPLARGLDRGQHRLVLSATGRVNIEGFRVPEINNSVPPWPVIAPLIILGLVSAVLLLRELRT